MPIGPRTCLAVGVGGVIAGAVAFAGVWPSARPTYSQSSATARIEVLDQIGGATNSLALVGDVVYAGVGPRVVALDVSIRDAAPTLLGQSAILPGVVIRMIHHEDHVFVITNGLTETHLIALNVVDPRAPIESGRLRTEWTAIDFSIDGDLAVITELNPETDADVAMGGLQIVGIRDAHRLEPLSWFTFEVDYEIVDVEALAARAYALHSDGRVRIVDMADPVAPFLTGSVWVPEAESIAVSSAPSRLLVASEASLVAFDLDDPDDPKESARIDGGYGYRVHVGDEAVWRFSTGTPSRIERYRIEDLAPLGGYWVRPGISELASGGGSLLGSSADSGVLLLPESASAEAVPVAEWSVPGEALRVDVDRDSTWIMSEQGFDRIAWEGGAHASARWRHSGNGRLFDMMAFDDHAITSHSIDGVRLHECAVVSPSPAADACPPIHSVALDVDGHLELIGRHGDHVYIADREGQLHSLALDEADGFRVEPPIRLSEPSVVGRNANVRMAFLDETLAIAPSNDGLARLDLRNPAAPVNLGLISLDTDDTPAAVVIAGDGDLFALSDVSSGRTFPSFSLMDDRLLYVLDGSPSDVPRVTRRIDGLPDNTLAREPDWFVLSPLPYSVLFRAPWIITPSRRGLYAIDPEAVAPVEDAAEADLAAIVSDLAPLATEGEFVAAAGDAGTYRLRIIDSASPTEAPTADSTPPPTRTATSAPTPTPPRPSTIYLPSVERPTTGASIAAIELETVLTERKVSFD